MPCAVCGELGDDDKTLLCEECDRPYHTFCLDPPLDGISGDDWFCPGCAPSTARYRPEKRQQGRPPKQTQTGRHSRGGKRARGSATSAAVGSGFDGASSYPEFESAKEVAKKRERADGGKAEASAKSDGRASRVGTPRQTSGVRAGASAARSQDATGATGRCMAHGGGKRHQEPGCYKSARGTTGRCIAHGGGKRCREQGCDKSARGTTGRRRAHGGGQALPGARVRQERTGHDRPLHIARRGHALPEAGEC